MSEHCSNNILVIGCGNPVREDDSLGLMAVQSIEDLSLVNVTVDSDYQLTLEHAKDLAEHDLVIFIDAMLHGNEPYSFLKVVPTPVENMYSHSVAPGEVLYLTNTIFQKYPQTYILGIRGYSFTMFKEGLTEKARDNLGKALHFLISVLQKNTFQPVAQLMDFHN